MSKVRNLIVGLVIIAVIALGAMKFLGIGIFSTEPSEGLIKAVTNIEQIQMLADRGKVNYNDVPALCENSMLLAGKQKKDKVLQKSIEETCMRATHFKEEGKKTTSNEYVEIEGSRSIYELAAIRYGVKPNDDNLYRTDNSELANRERVYIEDVGLDDMWFWIKFHPFKAILVGFIILAILGFLFDDSHHIDISFR